MRGSPPPLLLPLPSGVTPSAWTADMETAGPEGAAAAVLARDGGACRFCGDADPVAPAPFHLDGDHANWGADNLATACLLCHGAQHWNRPTIGQELVVIWAPWVPQGALNALALAVHRAFRCHGEPTALAARPAGDTPRLRAAWRAYAALAAQAAEAERIAGTASPRELGAALLDPVFRRRRPATLAGLRLLHLGRHFRGGRDVYPDLVDATLPKPLPGPR